ncbi:MAG: amidohydrolase family protein [Thermodesulfobacteriota bacterium]
MIIDGHHHLRKEENYLEKLVEECQRLGISRVCLMALPDYYDRSTNNMILNALRKYPDLIVGFAHFELGKAEPQKVDEYRSQGFVGLKMINPPKNYDDKQFYPVYQRAEELGMPILFHLGIVARDDRFRDYDINCNRMRPIYLDTIARAFPNLQIIGAHLGNPWYEEAAMACRWNPNLYFDLTGSTLKKKSPTDIQKLLWWTKTSCYRDPWGRDAWEKIIFGSDVPYDEIEDAMNDYKRTMAALGVREEIQKKVFGDTMQRILMDSSQR